MTNFADLLYSRSLAVFGVPAILTPATGDAAMITAIDQTAGVEITDHAIGIQVVRPAADVRRADIDAAGILISQIDGGTLEINGTSWGIAGIMEKPTPFGASDGLVTLLLVGNA